MGNEPSLHPIAASYHCSCLRNTSLVKGNEEGNVFCYTALGECGIETV